MTKIVFMGTPEFALPSLKRLIASHEVVGVVTQPDRPAGRGRQLQPPPVKLAAQANDIPVYQPISLRSEEQPTDKVIMNAKKITTIIHTTQSTHVLSSFINGIYISKGCII